MKDIYDLAIIGGGISSCTLIANIFKNGFKGKIAIVEAGRGLGGRCSSRYSKRNKKFILDHGAPNLNITNVSRNTKLSNFIYELIDNNLIKEFKNSHVEIDENYNFSYVTDNRFYEGKVYIPSHSMNLFAENLVQLNKDNNQVDFYFENLITKINFESNLWKITSNKNKKIISKFLVSSSNLLLHKRSLDILKVNEIPLKKALPVSNKNINEILTLVNKQEYIKRINFLIYPKFNFNPKRILDRDNFHIIFSNKAEKEIGFERIIFQKQPNNNFAFVIHTKECEILRNYLIKNDKKFLYDYLSSNLNKILKINSISDFDLICEDITIMNWRASQPIGLKIPKRLQLCKECNIAFCGDWFDFEGFGTIQGAILSALELSEKINNLI